MLVCLASSVKGLGRQALDELLVRLRVVVPACAALGEVAKHISQPHNRQVRQALPFHCPGREGALEDCLAPAPSADISFWFLSDSEVSYSFTLNLVVLVGVRG